MVKRNALGRGLGALIDDADKIKEQVSGIAEIEVSKIEANPFQPRTRFDQEALEELSVSIREIGLIQPITLRRFDGEKFQIIAGERRFRAAQMAGLTKIPAFIREADDDGMLEMALVENIQREDLDSIEIALSYQRLIDECNLTQETLSTRVGKKRSTVSNYLRLLRLPAVIQKGLREKEISMGHARALINIPESETQVMIFEQILKYDFSVRRVEEIVRNLNAEKSGQEESATEKGKLPQQYHNFRESLAKFFPTPVKLSVNNEGKGKIVISFKSADDLQKIVKIIENQK
ncbi:MAG TPA: ParB/RepB/Spo0J family partition protein [Prolixibacteraceae bacterium]|nr:ParB/RepB/Spo0J family partition protein [Prolixibacteraceae bacterium]